MSYLSGRAIRIAGIISPHRDTYKFNGLSGGETYAGYDVAVAEDIDLMPGQFELYSTVEYISVPAGFVGELADKSTLVRLGLTVQNTRLEPGWRGHLTLEIKNEHPQFLWMTKEADPDIYPQLVPNWGDRIRLPAGTPIGQLMFKPIMGPNALCEYNGKYQDQPARPVPAKWES